MKKSLTAAYFICSGVISGGSRGTLVVFYEAGYVHRYMYFYANDGKCPVDIEIDVGANEVFICR